MIETSISNLLVKYAQKNGFIIPFKIFLKMYLPKIAQRFSENNYIFCRTGLGSVWNGLNIVEKYLPSVKLLVSPIFSPPNSSQLKRLFILVTWPFPFKTHKNINIHSHTHYKYTHITTNTHIIFPENSCF